MRHLLSDLQFVVASISLALLVAGCALCFFVRFCRYFASVALWRLSRSTLAMLFVLVTVTAIIAQKDRTGGTGTRGISPVGVPRTGTTGIPTVAEELTNTLHFTAIDAHTNGTVTLTVAWPLDLIPTNSTIDLLAATSLVNSAWVWQCEHTVAACETNWVATVSATDDRGFCKAVVRDSLADMDDPDGDGLPNAYELTHQSNPWIADAESVPRLTVGEDGQYITLQAALAASEPYSVVSLAPGAYRIDNDIQMPSHPLMVTCEDGYAMLSGATQRAMFILGSGHECGHTLFRNLCLNLTSTNGMQAGFWCGGGLPWQGPGAAAMFEKVHIRTPNPDVEYFGWLFYGHCDATASIKGCSVNAAGAKWIYAVFGDNPPPIVVESCSFVNFSSQGPRQRAAIGLRSTHANGAITSTPPVTVSRVLFDTSFTNAWPLARFENADGFHVTMTDCIRPSESASADFLPNVANNVLVTNSLVTWAGFPLANSPAAFFGVGAFSPIANDPSVDMDGDGLSDYNEAYDHGTAPWLTDSDNDGISDAVEILQDGTDPTDSRSFKQRLTVTVTNTASLTCPVYLAWGCSEMGWETNGLAIFDSGFGYHDYTNEMSQVTTYVKAYCDMNGNGVYDADDDILLVRPVPPESMARIILAFGDVDGDNVPDAQERIDGTNPYDSNDFRLIATVKVQSSDMSSGLTNFVAWSYSAAGWEQNDMVRFSGSSLTFPVNAPVAGGELFVKVFRDFNVNGAYDADIDALVSNRLTQVDNGKIVTFNIGDSDGDKIPDSVELKEDTNPLDKRDYCFSLSLTYTGVFQTTNALTIAADFGTNRIYGPCAVSGNIWSNNFGHCVTTVGEKISVSVWDDANQNDEWNVGETSNKYEIAVTGHDMIVTNTLSYGDFDRNRNDIPDWWEMQMGLAADGVARRAYDDPDGDGLINLHEYWSGTDPLVPDGSNTLLSVAARSIDDRIGGSDPIASVPRFVDYFANGSINVFVANTNFWARDLDLSCVNVWNDGNYPGTQAATLITQKHVVMANHWWNDGSYTFCDTNGAVLARTIVDAKRISDDLLLGQLNEPLPNSFKPAHVPSTNIVRWLASGRYLPTLCLNQEKGASVAELMAVDAEITASGGRHYTHYGNTSQTNLVSRQRCNIRGATVDGNSGCPVFLVVGNELLLLFSKHLGHLSVETWSSSWGPSLPFRLEAIQRKIDEWEGVNTGSYQIVPFDFSSFGEIINQH